MKWSKEQKLIFKSALALKKGQHLVINADAGSGKTTALFEIMRRLNSDSMMLSFNKDIAIANKARCEKLGIKCDIKTFHSFGSSLFDKKFKKKLNFNKVLDHVRNLKLDYEKTRSYKHIISEIRNIGLFPYEKDYLLEQLNNNISLNLSSLNIRFAIDNINTVIDLLHKIANDRSCVDFDDMCIMPVYHGWFNKLPGYLFVDEIQDLNLGQRLMIKSYLEVNPDTCVIAVGDKKQNIYSFRGAYQSMESMIELLNVDKTYSLSTTYRCKSNIVDFVNNQIDESNMYANSKGGQVIKIKGSDLDDSISAIIGYKPDMIISQKNSILVYIWVSLFEQNIDATMKGTNIVSELRSLCRMISTYNFSQFKSSLVSITLDDFWTPIVDLAYALLDLIKRLKITSKHELLDVLDDMDNSKTGILLETVHSAKGREAPTVAVFCDWFNDKFDQLDNVKYVAFTRAINKLIVTKWE